MLVLPNRFLIRYILRFLEQAHLALLKDRFLKKMFLKRTQTLSPCRRQTKGVNHSFTLIENNLGCQDL